MHLLSRLVGACCAAFVSALCLVLVVADTSASPTASDAERSRVGEPLLPNMTPLVASDVHIVGRGAGRELRFETALASVGRGPMEIRPNNRLQCPAGQRGASQVIYRDVDGSGGFNRKQDTEFGRRVAGCMLFHPTHDHWHFAASTRYSLRPVEGPKILSAHRKMSFCLRDSERVPASYGTWNYSLFYGACSQDAPMGVSIGWSDVYQSFLDGQSLSLPPRLPDGRYCLRIRVDPSNQLKESRERDNVSERAIRIAGRRVALAPNRLCAA
ncbi:MAG: lysyl oxidase family protein [Actinomycetota bacterium]|nr:lysyl oxidase family protein [Actinomycetota bacterium]